MIHFVLLLGRVRMNKDAQGSPMDNKPRDERPKHRRAENVDLKHGDGVWADGFVPEDVDAEFRD